MTEKNRLIFETFLKTGNFSKGVTKIQSGFKKLSNLATGFATGFMGTQLLSMFKDWATEAGKLETINRSFARSFGNLSKEVGASLNKMGETIGRNERDLRQGAVSFNSFFKGLGFARKESAELSVKLQGLSLDLASFFGMSDQASQKRFIAALAGSPEVLDQFGINLKQAALQVELYARGIKTTVQNTSEMEKTHARLAIVMKSMTSAGIIGNAMESMDTYAGKVKQFDAEIVKLKENIGELLIPAIITLMDTLKTLAKIIGSIGIPFRFMKKTEDEFVAKRLREELEKIIVTKELINKLENENILNLKAEEILGKKAFKTYVQILEKLELLNKELEDVGENIYKQKILTNEIRLLNTEKLELQQKITEEIDKANTKLKEEQEIRETNRKLLQGELDAIKEKYDTQKRHEGLFEKDSSELETQKQLQQELLVIYGKQLKAGILTTEEYKKQTDELLAINTALMTVNTTEFKSKERERRRKATEDFDFVGAGDKKGSLNKRDFDLTNMTSTLSDQSKDFADALLDENKFLDRIREIMKNISIKTVDIMQLSFGDTSRKMIISLEQIAMPFINASMQLFDQMLTPPDSTLSKQEQTEQTKSAFAGIIVGLGQAMMAIGQGMVVIALGLETLKVEPIAGGVIGLAMIGMGAALVKTGKGKLQNLKNSAHSRNAGGGANGGSGVGGFSDMMSAIQGEQVFRLAGNDLVAAINRTHTFQRSIGSTRFG